MLSGNTTDVRGLDGALYRIPTNQLEDWDSWLDICGLVGRWAAPPYAEKIDAK